MKIKGISALAFWVCNELALKYEKGKSVIKNLLDIRFHRV